MMIKCVFILGELATLLQEATVNIISHNTCNKMYDDAVTPRMLCAGNIQGGVDACQVSEHLLTTYARMLIVCLFISLFITGRLRGAAGVPGTWAAVVSSRHCELGRGLRPAEPAWSLHTCH